MTRVKICGLMTEKDVHMCAKAGADAVGFVTEYPISVPWNISRIKTRDLAALTPPFMATTAVVGGSVKTILQIAETVRPNLLQLHGDETVTEIGQICLSLENTGTKVIKALRIDVDTGKAKFAIATTIVILARSFYYGHVRLNEKAISMNVRISVIQGNSSYVITIAT